MVALSATAAERINLSGLEAAQTYDRFIVKYRDGSSQRTDTAQLKASLDKAARVLPAAKGRAIGLQHVRRMAVQADVIKADRKLDAADAESLMRQIAADPNVEYVEVDKRNHVVFTPNDTNFSQQYGFGTGNGGIRATQAWDITSGAGTVVAVLDTGITNHSDLNANILPGYDFIIDTAVSADGNGRDSDPSDPGDGRHYAARQSPRAGTARMSPAPWLPSPTTPRASPVPRSAPRSCRCACSARAAATIRTSPMR